MMYKNWLVGDGKPYGKRIRKRILRAGFTILLGVLTLAAYAVFAQRLINFQGFYAGMGAALIASGVVTILKYLKVLRDAELLRKMEVMESDERNIYIGRKTWSLSGYLMYLELYVGMLVATFYSKPLALALAALLLINVVMTLLIGWHLRRNT